VQDATDHPTVVYSRLAMRLYWPKTEPSFVLPPGEGGWQPLRVQRTVQ
jgi:hypothetical protein